MYVDSALFWQWKKREIGTNWKLFVISKHASPGALVMEVLVGQPITDLDWK